MCQPDWQLVIADGIPLNPLLMEIEKLFGHYSINRTRINSGAILGKVLRTKNQKRYQIIAGLIKQFP